jgi:hypothetical protein
VNRRMEATYSYTSEMLIPLSTFTWCKDPGAPAVALLYPAVSCIDECWHVLQESPHSPAPAAANTQATKLNSSGSMPTLNQLSPWLVASDTSATTDTATKPVKHEQPVIHRKTVITTELWICAHHFEKEKSVK